MTNEKIYAMPFHKIYPLLVNKAIRKNRTKEEVDEIICWLTGYQKQQIQQCLQQEVSYQQFFQMAPKLNPNRHLITGKICGIEVSNIADPLMQNIRYLDKLIDELAKGKPLNRIFRKL